MVSIVMERNLPAMPTNVGLGTKVRVNAASLARVNKGKNIKTIKSGGSMNNSIQQRSRFSRAYKPPATEPRFGTPPKSGLRA